MIFALLSLSSPLLAAGSCDNYTPDVNGTTVTCTGVGSTSVGVISAQSDTTVGNSVAVNTNSGTSLIINGSTVGIGSAATVVNNGNLYTSSFLNSYGISSGANGIQVVNGGAITTINNSGVISAQGANSNGIQVTGAANITNSGTICPSTVVGGVCAASGAGSGNGIQIDNNANCTTITNTSSGLIGAPTTANYAIYSAQQPGVDIYNYGRSARFTEAPYDVLQ